MDIKIKRLKALADDTRFKILKLILSHNYCVGALSKRINISEAAISQHLKVLREAGLVRGEKRGYFTHYQADREALQELSNWLNTLSEDTEEPSMDAVKNDCKAKKKCNKTCHNPDKY